MIAPPLVVWLKQDLPRARYLQNAKYMIVQVRLDWRTLDPITFGGQLKSAEAWNKTMKETFSTEEQDSDDELEGFIDYGEIFRSAV